MKLNAVLIATLTTFASSVLASDGWGCAVEEGGPGTGLLEEIKGIFEDQFGSGDNDLKPPVWRAVKYKGLYFGVGNNEGYTKKDTAALRQQLVDEKDTIGDGYRCSWTGSGSADPAYDFGYEDDFSCGVAGGVWREGCDTRIVECTPVGCVVAKE